ncbi:MAG: thioesterase [Pygmaiobacter massiliensis]|nr:thioesterase [Pygmaiobacter massiliensis]
MICYDTPDRKQGNAFAEQVIAPQPDCDLNSQLTIGGLLRLTQQAGMDQCEALGVGTDYMLRFHTAWMLARLSVESYLPILEDSKLKVVTEPSIPSRATYKRVTSFYHQDGKLAAQVDARWVLADLQNRKILRQPPEGMQLPFFSLVETEHRVEIVRADSLESCGQVRACYSRVDLNGHLNNTRYADIICDALPLSLWDNGGRVRKMVIYYRNELPLGQSMELSLGRCDYHGSAAWYLVGTAQEKRCFEANVLF